MFENYIFFSEESSGIISGNQETFQKVLDQDENPQHDEDWVVGLGLGLGSGLGLGLHQDCTSSLGLH